MQIETGNDIVLPSPPPAAPLPLPKILPYKAVITLLSKLCAEAGPAGVGRLWEHLARFLGGGLQSYQWNSFKMTPLVFEMARNKGGSF